MLCTPQGVQQTRSSRHRSRAGTSPPRRAPPCGFGSLSARPHTRLDSCEKGCSVLPAEPGIPSTTYERFVQDLNTDPRPLLQDFLSPIRLGPVVKQVENNIRVRELSAHAQRRGSVARPWAVCPESGAILAKLHQREAHAEHAQPHRPLPGQSDRPPSGRVPAQDRRAAAPRENFPIWKLASSPH